MRPGSRIAAIAVAGGLLVTAPYTTAEASVRSAPAGAMAKAPAGVTAKGAVLYDAGAHRTLWSKAASTERPVASLTKVMTALLVLRAGHLNRKITVKKSWVTYVTHNSLSSAGLRTGDKVTARQLLSGMMLPSGCDAAYALAASSYGGTKKFVAKMNATAKSLGMTRTHYVTFDGTTSANGNGGYSTPNDQIKLAVTAMRSATFRAIADERTYNVAAGSGHHSYHWSNTDFLLNSGGVYGYRGAIGIKTGSTTAAGYCLLFAARRGNRTLYGVILNSTPKNYYGRFHEAGKILDWGFGTKTTMLIAPLRAGDPRD
jgi:serine-type D-Ala-D-Ala carboxypeptidase (penicillin-binding protein 5/6)